MNVTQYSLTRGSHGYEEDTQWLIEELIPKEALGCISGPPASFKNFVLLSIAAAIVSGQKWNNCNVEEGSVLYVAAEGGKGLCFLN
ncbi:AAA family ATPase, partial [Vibrio sp. 10N.286.52.F8]|uniref:AAA family ATPase n=1 Tax=Vibrio sp. 10N.286.52.F8 TaxID=3229716 RepID=UPI00354F960E